MTIHDDTLISLQRENQRLESELDRLRAELEEAMQYKKWHQEAIAEGLGYLKEIDCLHTENAALRKGIQDYLDGNHDGHPHSKIDECPHGKFQWEACEQCIDQHFRAILAKTAKEES